MPANLHPHCSMPVGTLAIRGICTDVVQDPTEHWQAVERGICTDVVQDPTEYWQAVQSVQWQVRRHDAFYVCGCIEPMPSLQTMDEAHTRGNSSRARVDSPFLIQRPALHPQQPPQHPLPIPHPRDVRNADDRTGLPG